MPEKSQRVKNIITMQETCCLQREVILIRISQRNEDTLAFPAYEWEHQLITKMVKGGSSK